MATHTLNNGKLKLVVNEAGGCVDSFQYINGFTFDVLRARVNTSNGFAGDSSMFPMLPMANRIRGNQFVWRGNKVVLPVSRAIDDMFFLHGNGWISDWGLLTKNAGDDFLELELTSSIDGVCEYHAKQSYQLCDDALIVTMVLTNLGDDAFPFGAGFHPFFSVQQDTLLEFPATGFWFEDKQNLPDRFVRHIPSDYNFNSEKTVPDLWINNGYQMSDSGVMASLRHKNGVSVLVSSPCRYLQVYKPSGESNFLCLEPQSHYVDAHNFGCESLSVLSQQESMQISMCIRIVT